MNYYQQIFTIGTFALYSFIFSLFIIPTVKSLKQIQYKLRGVVKPQSLLENPSFSQVNSEYDNQTRQIIDILEEYKLEYKEINKLKKFLIYGAIATFLSVALLFVFNLFSKQNTINWSSFAILIIYVVIIGILVIWAFITYVPSPQKITNWIYMAEHFGLSPSGLAKCANIKIDYNPKGTPYFVQNNPQERRPIRIFSNIELRGYKYWFFVYNLDDKTPVYILTGNVNDKTVVNELYPDSKDFRGWYINIAEFDAFKFKDKNLRIYFFVFDPITFGNIGNPYWGCRDFSYKENFIYSSEYSISLNENPYIQITYHGTGLHFKEFEWQEIPTMSEKDKAQNSLVKQVFDISQKKIRNVNMLTKVILEQ